MFDDEHFIQKNEYVKTFNIHKIYTSSVTEGAKIESNFYRPNQQMIYAMLYKWFGENPKPFHLTSIFLHILNGFLIFLFLLSLKWEKTWAFIGGLLFLIHPIQTEAVAYISGLADPLSLCFILLYLYSFQKVLSLHKNALIWTFLSLFFLWIALFTKENAVIAFGLGALLVFHQYFQEKMKISVLSWGLLSTSLISVVIYLYLKFTFFTFTGSAGLTTEQNVYTESLSLRICTFLNILPQYFKMFFYPVQLNYEKPYTAFDTWVNAKTFFSFALIGFTLYATFKSKKLKTVSFGLLFFFISISPFIGIIPLNAMYLEHWLYIPSIGLIIVFLSLFQKLTKANPFLKIPLQGIAILIFGLFSYKTYARNAEWANIEKFYLNELKYSKSARTYNNLAMYYADKKLNGKAILYYQKSIALYDAFPEPHHNLGNIYFDQQNYTEAVNEWKKALLLDPNFIYTWGKVYEFAMQQNNKQAAANIEATIKSIQAGKPVSQKEVHLVFGN